MNIFFLVGFVSFAIAIVTTLIIKTIALRTQLVDVPGSRSLHQAPVPHVGGIAIYFAFVLPLIFVLKMEYFPFLLAATIIFGLGLFDDIKGISPLGKLLGQCLAAAILIGSGLKIGLLPDLVSVPLTFFWLLGITNAMNLLDGMDGLAAGTTAIIAVFFAFLSIYNSQLQIALVSIALAGASMGFLKFNFHKASIFMGDTGSLLLGFSLASIAIMFTSTSTNILYLILPVIVLGVPIFDTFLAIVRRLIRNKPIFSADADHVFEFLWKSGKYKYNTVVFIAYAVSFALGVVALGLEILW
ncbi:MAG: undecaprenyl/decaprenyl-phosphate alpha-N-acetylglucosaminyl 1-phosphate transferase [Candidatus Margulisbacteria bacterium]|nr:undecaprenyl/decaprenyl-phosphate alpha-N-acetylglucosaminyl 1-phosphate transferase [Candidatus Margulisiibacteriota bacterium]